MQREKNRDDGQLWREKAIDLYVDSLDNGDLDGIAAVLEAAVKDPELDRAIHEINLVYQEEEQLTPIATDARLIRELIQKHLSSTFTGSEPTSRFAGAPENSLTVGEVAKRLRDTGRIPFTERSILDLLVTSSRTVPTNLNLTSIQQLAEQLQIEVSDRFLELFRETAILLSMGRSRGQALQAAREQKGHYKISPTSPSKTARSE